MRRLPDHIGKIGAGFNKDSGYVSADLIKRVDNVAIYLRSDGYYEVGVIRSAKGGETVIRGVEMTFIAKELYFGDSQFGHNAKCTPSLERAKEYMALYLSTHDKLVNEKRVYTS